MLQSARVDFLRDLSTTLNTHSQQQVPRVSEHSKDMHSLTSLILGFVRTVLLVLSLCHSLLISSKADAQMTGAEGPSVLDIFQNSAWTEDPAKSVCSFDFKSSGSQWAKGLDEHSVFLASLHSNSWQLGVGKGGQIYSFRGPFGESVPPQRKDAPWMDEVWQLVATSESIVDPVHSFQNANPAMRQAVAPFLYFIHQSGIYTGGRSGENHIVDSFYSPCLRKRWNPSTNALELVNWAQQANSPCVWKSGVLVYTSYRDVGGGVLEINQVLHNFGTERLNFFNTPWGGVRKSSLPHTVLSDGDDSWSAVSGTWGWENIPSQPIKKTGGWIGWVQDPESENSPALALVFGNRDVNGNGNLRWGTAGESYRDYEVTERILKIPLNPGDSLAVRWFLIVGSFSEVRNLAKKAADKASVTRPTYESKALQPIWADSSGINTEGSGKIWRELFAFPVPGTVPVFLIEDQRDGSLLITADPYALAETQPFPNPLPNDNPVFDTYQNRVVHFQNSSRIGYLNLLGFASSKKSEESSHPLVLPPTAPKNISLHESATGLWAPR